MMDSFNSSALRFKAQLQAQVGDAAGADNILSNLASFVEHHLFSPISLLHDFIKLDGIIRNRGCLQKCCSVSSIRSLRVVQTVCSPSLYTFPEGTSGFFEQAISQRM